MPYVSEGGVKYSDHHVTSPLSNISGSCQVCHRDSEETLRNFVYQRQDDLIEIRKRLEPELVKAHIMTKIAMENGATDEELKDARKLIRASQWRWDYVVASHGASFHAPLESARILSHGLDKALLAQLALKDVLYQKGVENFELPDISTKEKAQSYIGLDMPTLEAQKAEFMTTIVPAWLETAKKNGRI
jgi:nitrite reductase (cytochrome c-552)